MLTDTAIFQNNLKINESCRILVHVTLFQSITSWCIFFFGKLIYWFLMGYFSHVFLILKFILYILRKYGYDYAVLQCGSCPFWLTCSIINMQTCQTCRQCLCAKYVDVPHVWTASAVNRSSCVFFPMLYLHYHFYMTVWNRYSELTSKRISGRKKMLTTHFFFFFTVGSFLKCWFVWCMMVLFFDRVALGGHIV